MGTILSVTTGYGISLPDEIDWCQHTDWLPEDTDLEEPDTYDIFTEVARDHGLTWESAYYYDDPSGNAFLAPSTIHNEWGSGVFGIPRDTDNEPTFLEIMSLKEVAYIFKIEYAPSRLVVVSYG